MNYAQMHVKQVNITSLTAVILYLVLISKLVQADQDFCPISRTAEGEGCGTEGTMKDAIVSNKRTRYILYDVNPPEGFNLRRDVYMRLAVFVKKLAIQDWKLVLPPWGAMYHWQSSNVGAQNMLPWGQFFDTSSLKKYAPVIEMGEYLAQIQRGKRVVDEVYVLQHYKDMWEEGKDWEDRWQIDRCHEEIPYTNVGIVYKGPFWGYNNISSPKVYCVSFQGHASLLKGLLDSSNATSIMIDHAEVALHDVYGDREYWEARRSMRFAEKLVLIAADFRKKHLDSTDDADDTVRTADWQDEKEKQRRPRGGPYLAVHLRRKDFLWGRSKEVPDLKFAAAQLEELLHKHNLHKVFVATDAPKSEFAQFKSYLPKFKVFRFEPSASMKYDIKDGGVAIVDQIICSHARYFTGTHESTFSFRIQEEREIMGFSTAMTFNRLCGNNENIPCSQPSRWQIVF